MGSRFWKTRTGKGIIDLVRQGITPEKLALTVSLGVLLAVFPALGVTTLLCAAAALLLRLNMPAIQLINYLAYPLQFILLIPFIKLGDRLFGDGSVQFTLEGLLAMLESDVWHTVVALWWVTMRAAAAWFIFALPAAPLIYVMLLPLFRRLVRERNTLPTGPDPQEG